MPPVFSMISSKVGKKQHVTFFREIIITWRSLVFIAKYLMIKIASLRHPNKWKLLTKMYKPGILTDDAK